VTYEISKYLTFIGLFIVIYFCNEIQRDALLLKIYLIQYSTCFRQIHCPSSGVTTLYAQQQLLIMLVLLASASEVRMELTTLAYSQQN